MEFALKPLASLNGLLLAGLLATAGAGAMAQTPPPAPQAATLPAAGQPAKPHGESMGHHDPAKMQAWVAKRQAELKAKLQITPAQEGAWSTFTASMQPPARMGDRPAPEQRAQRRSEFEKLTTPQRIDKMREMRTQRTAERNAEMDKRGDAVKAFYAVLTPEQQKTFDAQRMMHGTHDEKSGPGAYGGNERHEGHRTGPAPTKS